MERFLKRPAADDAGSAAKRPNDAAPWTTPRPGVRVRTFGELPPRDDAPRKVLGLDFDGTIVNTSSKKKFPKDASDWVFFAPNVASVLADWAKTHAVVVFTNQLGVRSGKASEAMVLGRLDRALSALKVPLVAIASLEDDEHRKPRTAAWRLAEEYVGAADAAKSTFCGDAAGRAKDFSGSDRKFALNVGCAFMPPEELFLRRSADLPPLAFDPRQLREGALSDVLRPLVDGAAVVVLVGAPGCGKSTAARALAPEIERVNQDTLGTKAKCVAAVEAALAAGRRVVVDNTNRDAATRKSYLDAAKAKGVRARCLWFNVPKEVCFHGLAHRMLYPGEAHASVPAMIVHAFYKNLQAPTCDEGFDVVHELTIGDFIVEGDTYRKFLT